MAKKQKNKSGPTPRYKDITQLVDPKSVKDFDGFIDKINEFGDSLDGAARKSKHFKDNVSSAANDYKDALGGLDDVGKKLVKMFGIHADIAIDMTTSMTAFANQDFSRINPEVQKAILRKIELAKEMSETIEKVGLTSKAGMDFLQEYTGQIGGDIAQWVTGGSEFLTKLRAMGIVLAPIALFVGAIVASFRLVTNILKRAVSRLVEIEDASISIRKEFGLSAQSAKEFTAYISANREEFMALGIGSEQLASNISTAQREFGFIRDITGSELNLINQINARLGITADATAGVLKLFNLIGDESREVDQNMLLSTLALSEAGRVANADVFADIRDNSEQILLYFRGTDAELAQTTIRAKQLGLSLSHVTGFAEKVLDFESSISSELEASVLLGKQINLDRARRLAFDGDLLGLQSELLNITKKVGDFDKMNVFQRKAVADALGLSVMEMQNMVALETKLSKLSESDRKRFTQMSEQQKAQLSSQKEITSLDLDRVKSMGDLQNTTDRIRNSFGAMIGNLVKLAEPSVKRILATVTKLTKGLSDTLNNPEKRRAMEQSFHRVADSIGTLLEKLFKPENLDRIATVVETIVAGAVGVVDWIMSAFAGGGGGGSGTVKSIMDRSVGTSNPLASNNLRVGGVADTNNSINTSMAMVMAANTRSSIALYDEVKGGIVAYANINGTRLSNKMIEVNRT
jgi:hypothetical protein